MIEFEKQKKSIFKYSLKAKLVSKRLEISLLLSEGKAKLILVTLQVNLRNLFNESQQILLLIFQINLR